MRDTASTGVKRVLPGRADMSIQVCRRRKRTQMDAAWAGAISRRRGFAPYSAPDGRLDRAIRVLAVVLPVQRVCALDRLKGCR